MNVLELSEQEIGRRESLQQLRQMGINPYPAAEFPVDAWSTDIIENFEDLPVIGKDEDGNDVRETATPENSRMVSIAGRIMSKSIMGKAAFAKLQDSKGRIQVYVQRDAICPDENKDLYNIVFKKLLDLGDFIGVKGYVFRTKTGEISVHVMEMTVLSKSLKPLPVVKTDADGKVYDAFDDPELRYRQRYVDLIVNAGVKDTFLKRATIIRTLRSILDNAGYTEVDTPILQNIAGGASARPFITHFNALNQDMYMRIATERALPEAPHRRWFRGSLRDGQELPQRGYGQDPQPRVHLHGALCQLQGPALGYDLHREYAGADLHGCKRKARGRD